MKCFHKQVYKDFNERHCLKIISRLNAFIYVKMATFLFLYFMEWFKLYHFHRQIPLFYFSD